MFLITFFVLFLEIYYLSAIRLECVWREMLFDFFHIWLYKKLKYFFQKSKFIKNDKNKKNKLHK